MCLPNVASKKRTQNASPNPKKPHPLHSVLETKARKQKPTSKNRKQSGKNKKQHPKTENKVESEFL